MVEETDMIIVSNVDLEVKILELVESSKTVTVSNVDVGVKILEEVTNAVLVDVSEAVVAQEVGRLDQLKVLELIEPEN